MAIDDRRLENHAETYTRLGHRVPQRVISIFGNVKNLDKIAYQYYLVKVDYIVLL